ncbi:vacuolar sorting protein [Schizosaccharomyces cryophilus OY26]|uniref:Vacuolar sorting protein n=1 Tax=Schizosaccharomyces cryophilus (strain OY26 / ATCC MYA-4695 / CBS 11777 / NBRC 106824 / NRRL Y48691) TaxID=653667 RepID=S9X8V2_SCHCR|nr:vacuolar sorting protein [Schizosaccharomyces cryophilus OY26]EPY53617.1 vacuolar sorting protein [Schizosaccharomyces cryophilus OY26]
MAMHEDESLIDFLKKKGIFKESRLRSLFSDFRNLYLKNPEGFKANIDTWKDAIETASFHNKLKSKLTVRFDEDLENSFFSSSFGKPLSLGVIASYLHEKGIWPKISEFLHVCKDPNLGSQSYFSLHSWIQWGSNIISSRLQRGIQFGSSYPSDILVLVKNVELLASLIRKEAHRLQSTYTSTIYTWSSFQSTFGPILWKDTILSSDELECLLQWMCHRMHLIVFDKDTIKFLPSDTQEGILETADKSIAAIMESRSSIYKSKDAVNQKIEDFSLRVQEAISKAEKLTALTYLRRKKILLKESERKEAALLQVDSLLSSIDEAFESKLLLSALSSGSEVLKSVVGQMGGIEHVNEILDSVQEAKLDFQEIDSAITATTAPEADVDTEELEKEWEDLIKEDKKEEDLTAMLNRVSLNPSSKPLPSSKGQLSKGTEPTMKEAEPSS